jgi:hypothetical protein
MVTFAHRATQQGSSVEHAQNGFLAKIKNLTLGEKNYWTFDFNRMVESIKKRRDTVWGFIRKNTFRPAYLRRQKVDVIIGNPPWLSFRDIAEQRSDQGSHVQVCPTRQGRAEAVHANGALNIVLRPLSKRVLKPGGQNLLRNA